MLFASASSFAQSDFIVVFLSTCGAAGAAWLSYWLATREARRQKRERETLIDAEILGIHDIPGVPNRPSVSQRLGTLEIGMAGLQRELHPNGGSSLADTINATHQLAQQALERATELAEARETQPQIVIADDEDAVRTSASEILRASGYVVFEATDGDEAVRLLNNHEIDVLILDIKMPRRDGLSVLEALEGPVPIVVLITAYQEAIDEWTQRRIFKRLLKPVSPVSLLETTAEAVTAAKHEKRP